jgi:hypothetical protein
MPFPGFKTAGFGDIVEQGCGSGQMNIQQRRGLVHMPAQAQRDIADHDGMIDNMVHHSHLPDDLKALVVRGYFHKILLQLYAVLI